MTFLQYSAAIFAIARSPLAEGRCSGLARPLQTGPPEDRLLQSAAVFGLALSIACGGEEQITEPVAPSGKADEARVAAEIALSQALRPGFVARSAVRMLGPACSYDAVGDCAPDQVCSPQPRGARCTPCVATESFSLANCNQTKGCECVLAKPEGHAHPLGACESNRCMPIPGQGCRVDVALSLQDIGAELATVWYCALPLTSMSQATLKDCPANRYNCDELGPCESSEPCE